MSNPNDAFELVVAGIRVRDTAGNKINRVPTPKGFTDLMFRNIVAAFDTAYRMTGMVPDITQVVKLYPSASSKVVSALYLTEEFQLALEYRGIQWDIDSGLSLEQNMVLTKLNDYTDRRSTGVKLRELGVPMARYQAWQHQPLFARIYQKGAEDNLANANAMVINKLLGNAEASDQRAIEKVLEITGRFDPQLRDVEDARTVVMTVIESIMRHVADPEVRKAIMADVALSATVLEAARGAAKEISK